MNQVEHDIQLMVGGHFTPAAMTPEGYDEILARARSQVAEYLDEFERLFLGANFDAQVQSHLYLPSFLDHLRDVAPERVRAVAEQLLRQYRAILVVFDQVADKAMLDSLLPSDSVDLLFRLNDRRIELERLIQGLG